MSDRGIINDYDLSIATGLHFMTDGYIITGPTDSKVRAPKGEGSIYERLVSAAGLTHVEWVRPRGNRMADAWFPSSVVAKAKELDLRWKETGKPVTFTAPGMPCEERIVGDWTSHLCDRPVAGTDPKRGRPLCSMHLKVIDRQIAREAQWVREREEAREARLRRKANREMAEEVMEWAGPLLAEVGIHPSTAAVGSIGERTGILLPAEAVETLVALATGERRPRS